MGTSVITNAAVGLPIIGQHMGQFGLVIWVITSIILIVMLLLKTVQKVIKPPIIERQFNAPVMDQFFGAPLKALLTIAGVILLFSYRFLPW
tara:strand:+ start:145 stop:417 length:273 start_codon:yes stop_codon:yes gene_type:complete